MRSLIDAIDFYDVSAERWPGSSGQVLVVDKGSLCRLPLRWAVVGVTHRCRRDAAFARQGSNAVACGCRSLAR